MIIIGEKINGSIPAVADAIARRDADFVKSRAKLQADSGASFIDCCASVPEADEPETLKWMIDCIQEVTDLPISLDSPSPDVLLQVFPYCRRPGLINSVSGEGDKIDKIFPAISGTSWQVICLLSDDTGIPKCAEDRLKAVSYTHLDVYKRQLFDHFLAYAENPSENDSLPDPAVEFHSCGAPAGKQAYCAHSPQDQMPSKASSTSDPPWSVLLSSPSFSPGM